MAQQKREETIASETFELGEEQFSSISSFAYAIQLPVDHPKREEIALMSKDDANAVLHTLKENDPEVDGQIHWSNQSFPQRSPEHQELIQHAKKAYYQAQGVQEKPVNIVSYSHRTKFISNFAETPFTLGNESFASVEAFIQAIKYPEDHPERERVKTLSGSEAKKAGSGPVMSTIVKALSAGEKAHVYWNGSRVAFQSDEHHHLIANAMAAKFEQDSGAAAQLLATKDRPLIHKPGRRNTDSPYTSLPNEKFCQILTSIRTRLREK